MESSFSKHILVPFVQSIDAHRFEPALNIAGTSYTYFQLAQRITAIRQALRQHSSQDAIAALAIHDDIDTYASIFALWMEGKAYVPLHPNQPLERNKGIIGQVGTRLILDSAETSPFDALNTSRLKSIGSSLSLTDWVSTSDDQLAYILFTSGSTGIPKGVTISRRNI